MAAKEESNPVGRPTKYTPELSDQICQLIAEGQSLRTICREESMPCMATIFCWLRTNKEFLEHYEKAKQEQADAMAEEMLDIADDGTNDWMIRHNKDGSESEVLNTEHVQRSRLRIDTRKWLASKLKPKKYGEKTQIVGGDEGDKPIAHEHTIRPALTKEEWLSAHGVGTSARAAE